MSKQQITIEVDVPEGLSAYVHKYEQLDDTNVVVQIAYRAFVWPNWLLADWLAMDQNGNWCAYEREPEMREEADGDGYWYSENGEYAEFKNLVVLDVPLTDWRQSKRRRPT